MLHRLADTDLVAQLDYQDSIGAFHKQLRTFFYPYLFLDRPITRADLARLPSYSARAGTASWPTRAMLMLLAITGLVLAAALQPMRRTSPLL
jgi:ABC-2 type transport system permease protein